MLRIYLPSSTDLKLCSDVPTVDFVNTWTFVTIFTSRYLGSNIWVLTIVGWKCEDESAKMKVRGWKWKEESARMKVGGWKCEDDKMLGMKVSKDGKTKDENARMKLRGWSGSTENDQHQKMINMVNSENDQHSTYINCGNNFEENDQHIKKLAVAFGK